jgi:hypothetical protein
MRRTYYTNQIAGRAQLAECCAYCLRVLGPITVEVFEAALAREGLA